MEYLSRLLEVPTTTEFNFHAKCAELRITHLAFADDLMLFCRGDLGSMRILTDAMDEFSDCSGLQINGDKSQLFAGGVHVGSFMILRRYLCFRWENSRPNI